MFLSPIPFHRWGVLRRFEQSVRPQNVHTSELQRHSKRQIHVALRREMKHRVHLMFLDERHDELRVDNVALDKEEVGELHDVLKVLERRAVVHHVKADQKNVGVLAREMPRFD